MSRSSKSVGDGRGGIAGVEADVADVEVEAGALAIEPAEVDDAVGYVAWSGEGVGDDAVAPVDGGMIEEEEALRLAVAHHIAALGVGAGDLGLLHHRLALVRRQRCKAVGGAVDLHRPVEIAPPLGARLGHRRPVEAVLVGAGLQMSAVGVEHRAVDQAVIDRLLDYPVEDVLRHRGVVEAPPPVLRQRRGVEHRVGLAKQVILREQLIERLSSCVDGPL